MAGRLIAQTDAAGMIRSTQPTPRHLLASTDDDDSVSIASPTLSPLNVFLMVSVGLLVGIALGIVVGMGVALRAMRHHGGGRHHGHLRDDGLKACHTAAAGLLNV